MHFAARGEYYACSYCTTFSFPETTDDHVLVTDAPADLACPVCGAPLVHGSVAGSPILYCPRCRGLLLDQLHFAAVVAELRRQFAGAPPPPQPLAARDLDRHMPCPWCGRAMDTHPYYGPGRVIIDNCCACRVLWLDHGELHRIVTAPE